MITSDLIMDMGDFASDLVLSDIANTLKMILNSTYTKKLFVDYNHLVGKAQNLEEEGKQITLTEADIELFVKVLPFNERMKQIKALLEEYLYDIEALDDIEE